MSEVIVEGKEYAGVPLLFPLIAETKYRVAFHVSFGDSSWYAGKNIGAYLSIGELPDDITSLLSFDPHIRYEGEQFLTDKEGWTLIEGTYVAQGGENFLTIGNFDADSETETVFVEGGGVLKPNAPDYWKGVYYFIDDVSVVEDRDVGIGKVEELHFGLWPIPAMESITIETEYRPNLEVALYDMAGREVFSSSLQSSAQTINIGHLPAGMYVAVLSQKDVAMARRKLVVE